MSFEILTATFPNLPPIPLTTLYFHHHKMTEGGMVLEEYPIGTTMGSFFKVVEWWHIEEWSGDIAIVPR